MGKAAQVVTINVERAVQFLKQRLAKGGLADKID